MIVGSIKASTKLKQQAMASFNACDMPEYIGNPSQKHKCVAPLTDLTPQNHVTQNLAST